jgi:hypothetical protein
MKTPIKILIAVIIVVVLGVGASAAIILTADPYKKAETAYFGELIPYAANAEYTDGYSATYDFTYTYNETIGSFLGVEAGEITLHGDMDALTNAQRISMYLTEGSDTLGGEVIMPGGDKAYVLMPEITKYVMVQELSGTTEMPEIDIPALIKSGAKISDIYFDTAKENGVYDKEELINGGETYNCDTFTINFTGDIVYSLLSQSVDEIRKNESLMAYLNTLGEVQDTDFEDELDTMLEDAQYSLEEIGGDTVLTMKVYIYKGKIVGRIFENFYETEDMRFEFYDTEKDGMRDQLLKIESTDQTITYNGDFEVVDGYYSGTADFESKTVDYYDEEQITTIFAEITDFKYYPEGGFTEGNIDIEFDMPSSGVGINLNLFMTKDGNSQIADITGEIESAFITLDIGEVNAVISIDDKNPKIEAPEIDEAYIIELESPDSEKMEAFEADVEAAIGKLSTDGLMYSIFGSIL